REGLDRAPLLGRYGWDEVGPDGFLAVSGGGLPGPCRVICLTGDRRLGPGALNPVPFARGPGGGAGPGGRERSVGVVRAGALPVHLPDRGPAARAGALQLRPVRRRLRRRVGPVGAEASVRVGQARRLTARRG